MTLLGMAFGSAALGGAPAALSQVSHGILIVANKGDRGIGIIDPAVGRQIAEIPTGGNTAHEVAASPDGRIVYAPIYGDSGVGKPGSDGDTIAVIDVADRKVVGHVNFDKGVRPHLPIYDSHRNLLYVTTELERSISIIDPKALKIVGSVPTGQEQSHMLAISRDGRRGYTANVGPGTVSVLDMVNHRTLQVIPVAHGVQRISVSRDDRYVFTSDTEQPRLAVIDAGSNRVTNWVALPGLGYGTAPSLDGKWLLVAVPAANQVVAVDLGKMQVGHAIDVCPDPQEVVTRPDDPSIAYVSCSRSGQVGVLDLSSWKMQKAIAAGRGVDGMTWIPGS